MRLSFTSVRARLVVSLTLAFASIAFVAFYIQTRTLERNDEIAHWGQRFSAVQLAKLYVELSFPGEWQSHDGFLYKGHHRFIDGSAISSLLSDYLPPDTTIHFVVGAPPAEAHPNFRPETLERVVQVMQQGRTVGPRRPASEVFHVEFRHPSSLECFCIWCRPVLKGHGFSRAVKGA